MRITALCQIGLHVSIVIGVISTTTLLPALAQSPNSNRSEFPGRRIGGGTRGECSMNSQSLTALTPANNLGITASDRPTVYFVVPQSSESYPIQFVLRDTNGTSVYNTTLATSQAKQLLGVQLPSNMVKAGQDYQWYFSVVCDPDDSSQNLVLSGWLRRVSAQIPTQNGTDVAAQLNLASAYQGAGLSSDEIAVLAKLHQTHPDHNQVRQQWQQLLQKLELQQVSQLSIASQ